MPTDTDLRKIEQAEGSALGLAEYRRFCKENELPFHFWDVLPPEAFDADIALAENVLHPEAITIFHVVGTTTVVHAGSILRFELNVRREVTFVREDAARYFASAEDQEVELLALRSRLKAVSGAIGAIVGVVPWAVYFVGLFYGVVHEYAVVIPIAAIPLAGWLEGRLEAVPSTRGEQAGWPEIHRRLAVLRRQLHTIRGGRPNPLAYPDEAEPRSASTGAVTTGKDSATPPITIKNALDTIVKDLAQINVKLSGDDSPLADPWEEIKEQLQHGLSLHWSSYLATMRQFIDAFADRLSDSERATLMSALRCSSNEHMRKKLLQRLLARGKREKIRYAPFDFEFFSYRLLDMTCYGRVLRRTGLNEFEAEVFSPAAQFGEHGTLSGDVVQNVLTREEFESARSRRWDVVPSQ